MKIISLFLFASLFCIQTTASADDINIHRGSNKETAGFGMGAVIGGLLAGPPGAIIGAASGGWFGTKATEADRKIAALEKELNAKSIELAYKQNELVSTREKYKREFQQVALNKEIQSLEKLSQGISYVIHYKTNDADLRHDVRPQIQQLADLVKPFPLIKIQIEGYADARGTKAYNLNLSKQRIDNVRSQFINAGIPNKRLQTHAYGEQQSSLNKTDQEDYMFDRRVMIKLTLDREA